MEDVIKHFDMKGCNSVYKPDEEPKLSLYQKVNLLDEEHGCCYVS